MSRVFLPPYTEPTFQTDISSDREAIPAPQLDEVPFPKSGRKPVNKSGMPAIPPIHFPVMPDSHYSKSPGLVPPDAYKGKTDVNVGRKTLRSSLPSIVGLFFLAVELLLLLRLVFSLFGIPISHVWVEFVYTISTFFLLPFFLLFQNVHIPLINGTQFYSDLMIVCAIFAYGLTSRILVGIFKAVFIVR